MNTRSYAAVAAATLAFAGIVVAAKGSPYAAASRHLSVTPQELSSSDLDQLEGASIIANDGHYLGMISKDKYATDSISNQFGKYGSSTSSDSIMNRFGKYGSETSDLSPFDDFTSHPPKIELKNNRYSYLTTNSTISPRYDTNQVVGYFTR